MTATAAESTERETRIKDERLARVLAGEELLVFDGGMGTMIQRAGLAGVAAQPDLLNLTHPDQIRQIQRAYVEAGCDVVTTNTFGSNRVKLKGAADVAELYAAAADIARSTGAAYAAGDIGPTGALLAPLGPLSFDDAYEAFAEQARAVEEAGCDLVIVETMADLREAKAAVLAALDNTTLPVFATMTFEAGGRTLFGTSAANAAATLSALGVSALGVNCSLGPNELVPVVAEIARYATCPVIAQPNAGLPHVVDGETCYDIDAAGFAEAMQGILDAGASIVGGCCGTDPDFIAGLARLAADRAPAPRKTSDAFVVTYSQGVAEVPDPAGDEVRIGFVDAAADDDLAEAVADGEYDDLADEVDDLACDDTAIVGLSMYVPDGDADERDALVQSVEAIQDARVEAALCLAAHDAAALEAAARAYVGKPLTAFAGDDAAARAGELLALAKRCGCAALVKLPDGACTSDEQALAAARGMLEAADRAGVRRCDVAVDCADAPGIAARIRSDLGMFALVDGVIS